MEKMMYGAKLALVLLFFVIVSTTCSLRESMPIILSMRPKDATILVKGNIVFECSVLGLPLAQITWKKNNRKLSENHKKFRIVHGTNVSYLRVIDASYSRMDITCMAENSIGKDEQTVVLNVIQEREKHLFFPFATITYPKSVEPNTLFKLECNVTNLNSPVGVQWYQANRPISFGNEKYFSNFSIIDESTIQHNLYVNGLSLSSELYDSMEIDFLCSATNSYGTFSTETSIMLRNRLMPPSFISPKRSLIEMDYGSSINVTCNANGMPRPRVKWLEGSFNQILDLSESLLVATHRPRFYYMTMNKNHLPTNVDILQVKNLTQSKNFTCQAQNSFGLVLFNLTLFIKARPETPIGPNVTTIYFNSIELEWKPGGISEIAYYLVKYKKIDLNQKNIEDNNIDSSYSIFNTTSTRVKIGNSLKPYTFYEFRLVAVNQLGQSLPTDSLVVRTAAAKPGNVKNIRYTFQKDNLYLIKCDEPDDANGKLIHFVIYHTNQVTNPIRNWNAVRVPVQDMPYLLSINARLASNEFGSYYLRMSAVNQELGEGPYSQIVELKYFEKKFDPPYNFETLSVNSSYALLKWNFKLDVLKSIYRQYNNLNIYHESTSYRHSEENEIIKNLNFEIYLKKDKFWPSLRSFRRIAGLDLIRKIGLKRLFTRQIENFLAYQIPFEYNMTNLEPNKSYAFELAARLYNVESQITQTLYLTTKELSDHADKFRLSDGVRVDSLSVAGKDAQSITLGWSLPSVVDTEWVAFKIKYSTDNLIYTPILLKNINLRKFRIDNLRPDTQYKIQISAVNKNELEGPATDFLLVRTLDAVPGEPQDFKVVKVTSRTIELEWKAPRREEQSSSNNIKGYEIHYYKVNPAGTGPNSLFSDTQDTQIFKRKTNNVKKLKYTLTDLEPNSQYQIQIFAYNMKGDGQRSSPLMVTTLDEGPGKPEDIRSEIYNDQLNIKWQAPSIKPELVDAYVIHFNNERYQVNGQTNQISFPGSKWEYDRQYEFRIYAKTSGDSVPHGAEAVFRISTQINQKKLSIQLEKLTSRSVLIKWNSVTLSKVSPTYYKLEYSLKSDPSNVVTHDRLTDTELQLYNLRANSEYVIQLIAISMDNSNLFSEPCIKHFRTLLIDIDPPINLQVIRFEADKISIKWELANRHPNYKLFRIYFKELNPAHNYDDLHYDVESLDEWRAFDQPIEQTELILEDLNPERDYAVKVLVVDRSDTEGPETAVKIAYRLKKKELNHVVDYSQAGSSSNQPREVEILEFTSTSVKFSWMPPEPSKDFKIDKFLISYVDREKVYRETNGSMVNYHKGLVLSIRAPARDDPSIRITWLVNGLTPNTDYDFNISSILANNIPSQPIKKHIKTKVDKPFRVDAPKILQIYDDNTVRFENGNASEFHGPILKYWFVVVPLGYELQHDKYIDDTNQERDIHLLLKYSLINENFSNQSAFIAAEFDAKHWPREFILGDGNKFGRFKNRYLIKGYEYRAYVVAFTDDSAKSANMLGLGDIFASRQTNTHAIDSDLFASSPLSTVFNTRYALNSHLSSIKLVDYQNIVWIITAIVLFVVVFVLITAVSLAMKKKRGKYIENVTNANSATSSTITTGKNAVDTQVLMNNMGSYTVNSIKKNSDSRSSSSSSTTTVSPTTALLSCSVNNSNNMGSQTSQNTNALINTNGLLTTASPIRNMTPQIESLYTSIEVTQKLLQQQDFLNTFTGGTLNRATLGLINQYDPIEYRRAHYPTQSLLVNPPIQIDQLAQHIDTLKMDNNTKFTQEYESIEPGQQFTWEHSSMEMNRLKNRYANVVAYDHSRVILSRLPTSHFNICNHMVNFGEISPPLPPPPPLPPGCTETSNVLQSNCSDYINANYVDGCKKRNAFIATQGPLPSTIGDFWRMIWEQQTCTIVMMTKLEERNRLKCDQYWPTKGSEIYDNCVQVNLVDQSELSSYTMRTFVITPVGLYAQSQMSTNSSNINYETRREIKHFQFTAWPDHGVPEHPTQFLQFVRRVHNSNPSDAGPVLVHCSAGVGRTGCYIVVDTMLERMRFDKTLDIYGYVTCMRAQRNYMVQTEDQYVFCYDAVLEACQTGHTEIPSHNLYQHLQRLLQVSADDPSSMLTEMELEYKKLSGIKAPQSKFHSANLPANKFKNRLVNILPYETTRVVLQSLPGSAESSGTDYINASYIDGYKYKKAYIATQAPLVETIDDFWRMLWEHNSTIVVMLTKLREMGREKCAQYWPNERSIRYQYFVVDPIAEYNMSQYILREFKVTDARDGQSRTIRQFQFIDWPEQGVPKSGESIVELIGQVHKTKEQFGQTGPITVHCSAGVGRTGVFITLSIVLERMRFEGLVDVFNTVKILRTQRSAMVQTEDQYQFCYRAALEYLGSFDGYE